MSDINGKEIVDALGQFEKNMTDHLNRIETRLERIEVILEQLEDGQRLLNDRLFQTEKDVSLLKRIK